MSGDDHFLFGIWENQPIIGIFFFFSFLSSVLEIGGSFYLLLVLFHIQLHLFLFYFFFCLLINLLFIIINILFCFVAKDVFLKS